MKVITQTTSTILLRFDTGEDVMAGLVSFAKEKQLVGASFTALGASAAVVLSYYHLLKKSYEDFTLYEEMEIVSMIGNIGLFEGKPVIHAHGVFADKTLATKGGHIKKLIVSATCEVTLMLLPQALERAYDEKTGLNLLS